MFKRLGALAALPISLAMTGVMMLSVGTATAKPSVSAYIEETTNCHFQVSYRWVGMGHGNDLKATVHLSGWEGVNSNGLDSAFAAPVSGSDGFLQHDFVVSGAPAWVDHFSGYGELTIVSKSQIITKSVALTLKVLNHGC